MYIVTDACPSGIGAFLKVDGVILAWFADAVTSEDRRLLGIAPGSSGQQTCEALAALVALRIWLSYWASDRVQLQVRTDNVTTIALLARLKASSKPLRTIAKEFALLCASPSFEPDVIEHTPGIQNSLADALSRRFEADGWTTPHLLEDVPEVSPPSRQRSWWLTLLPPQLPSAPSTLTWP